MSLSSTVIRSVSRSTANRFLSEFEILGDVGLGVWHWGLFSGEDLISVISIGVPCFGGRRGWLADLGASRGICIRQLARGGTVPDAPVGTGSRAISLALRSHREVYGSFIAVAYADESLGEVGTIYQASGAVYTGMTEPKGQANYVLGGKRLSGWVVRKQFGTRCRKRLMEIDPSLQVLPLKRKHRYVFIGAPRLEKRRVVERLSRWIRPYPRREVVSSAD